MATNITYLLGAGASANKLPVIGNLAEKVLGFLTHFKGGTKHSRKLNAAIGEIINSLEWIIEESRNYNTIDTYAKKLFLHDKHIELHKLKITLALCFYYWQFYDGRGTAKASPNIDSRYISLISSFIKRDKDSKKLVLPENLNFITWNYDVQLELALQYFLDEEASISEVQQQFKSYPNTYLEGYSEVPQIVHLNGIAGLYAKESKCDLAMDRLKRRYNDWAQFSEQILWFYDLCAIRQVAHIGHTFSFAWEENPISRKGIEHAIDIMNKTTHLVVVGYSFPVFNREIDRRLFENSGQFHKVYYQDSKPDSNALAETFSIAPFKIKEFDKKEQFFLPFEF